jgi:AICAR transformylase/IMP cyclohydrolase PurH
MAVYFQIHVRNGTNMHRRFMKATLAYPDLIERVFRGKDGQHGPVGEVFRASQVIVPLKTGDLKASGWIKTETKNQNMVEVHIRYGDNPARKPVVYAHFQHEGFFNFKQRRKNVKNIIRTGRGATQFRQRKYLEKPFNAMMSKLPGKLLIQMRLQTIIP